MFNITDIFNFVIISMLITLAFYHLSIYFGRRMIEKDYNYIYFAVFAIFMSLFIIGRSHFITKTASTIPILNNLLPVYFATCATIFTFAGMNLTNKIINYPKTTLLKIVIGIMCVAVSLTLSSIFMGETFFKNYLFIPTISLFVLASGIYVWKDFKWLMKNSLFKKRTPKLMAIAFLMPIISVPFKIILEAFKCPIRPEDNFFDMALSVLIFAYVLSIKFNEEYKALNILQNSLQQQVKDRTAELEKEKEGKTLFLMNVAHEIKTPLSLIRGYTDILLDENRENMEMKITKQNIDKLLKDIVNFMDSERFEKGIMNYDHNQIINILQFSETKIKLFEGMAKKKKISIKLKTTKEFHMKADPWALDRVYNNIIDNAIKYSPENGKITISITGDENSVFISFKDTGKGIPPEQINCLSKPYHQINSEKKNYQGLGLGLYIVNEAVKSIGGTLEIKSDINSV